MTYLEIKTACEPLKQEHIEAITSLCGGRAKWTRGHEATWERQDFISLYNREIATNRLDKIIEDGLSSLTNNYKTLGEILSDFAKEHNTTTDKALELWDKVGTDLDIASTWLVMSELLES